MVATATDTSDDLSALAWVQDELRRSLELANKALRRYLKESESANDLDSVDPGVLRQARNQLHQSVGVLELVGLGRPAVVLRAAEAALQRLSSRPRMITLQAVHIIEHGTFGVLDLIARRLNGKPVTALALFPQYRALQELAAAPRVHPSDLWDVPWSWRNLPVDTAVAPSRASADAISAIEADLLALMRGAPPATATRMSQQFAALAAGSQGRLATLWQLASAVFEALGDGVLQLDVYSKRAGSRLLSQLRAGDQGEPSERLAHDLLFFCSQARAQQGHVPGPRVAAVRQAWQLPDQPPVDLNVPRLGRFDPAWVAQARKRILSAKDVWSAVAGGDVDRLPMLTEQFALVSDSLQRLYADGSLLGRALQVAVAQTAASGREPPAALAMEVATALLYLDASIDDADFDQPDTSPRIARLAQRIELVRQGRDPGVLELWMEDLYRRVSDRQTMGSVVQELRASLSEVEKNIDQYFRDPSQRQVLIPVPAQLQAMRGVLSVLGLDQASAAVLRMRDDVDALANTEVDPQRAIQTGTFDHLADNLGALSFLIDMVSVQPQMAKSLFRFDPKTGNLSAVVSREERPSGFGALESGFAAAEAEPEPSALSRDTDALAVSLDFDRLVRRAGRQGGSQPPTPGEPAPPVAMGNHGMPLLHLDEPISRRDDLHAPRPVAPEDDDAITLRLPPVPQQALHLTGDASDRTVKVTADDGITLRLPSEPADPTLRMPAPVAPEPTVIERAASHTPMAPPPAAPAPDNALQDDPEMREVFLDEAREVLATARAGVQSLAGNPTDNAAMTTVRRAMHTLKGSSRMVGLKPFGEAAWACEQLYNARLADQSPADGDLCGFTDEACGYFERWVEALAGGDAAGFHPDGVMHAAHRLRLEKRRLSLNEAEASASEGLAQLGLSAASAAAPKAAPALQWRLPDLPTATDLDLSEPWAPEPSALPDLELTALDDGSGMIAVAEATELAELTDLPLPLELPALPDITLTPEPVAAGLPTLPASPAQPVQALDDTLPMPNPASATPQVPDALSTLGLPSLAEPTTPRVLGVRLLTPSAAPSAFPPAIPAPASHAPAATPATAPDATLPLQHPLLDATLPMPAALDATLPMPPAMDSTLPMPAALEATLPLTPDLDATLPMPAAPASAMPAASEPEPAPAPAETTAALATDALPSEAYKQIGPLRIGIPLFNIYLNEADEVSRRLTVELAEWSHELHRPVGDAAVALAHSLAGGSGTVGFADLSALARGLEHALDRSQARGHGQLAEAQLFIRAADEIRRLLHLFAAGFLNVPDPALLQALHDIAHAPPDQPSADDEAELDVDLGEGASVDLDLNLVEPVDQAAQTPEEALHDSPTKPLPSLPPAPPMLPLGRTALTSLADLPRDNQRPAPAHDDAPQLDDEIDAVDVLDAELFPIFEEEALELLPELQSRLRDWSHRPTEAAASSACMRSLHTLKGSARLAGAMRLGEMAHRLETAIERLVAQPEPTTADVEQLLVRTDALEAHFDTLRGVTPKPAPAAPVPPLAAPHSALPQAAHLVEPDARPAVDATEAKLALAMVQAPPPAADAPPARAGGLAEAAAVAAAAAVSSQGTPVPQIDWRRFTQPAPAPLDAIAAATPRPGSVQGSVRVRAQLLDRLVNQAGEVSIARSRIDTEVQQLKSAYSDLSDNLERLRAQLRDIELQAETQIATRLEAARSAAREFDPLEMDRFTRFQELTRMMAESVSDVATVQRGLQRTVQSAEDALAHQARMTRAMQDDLLRTRMVEFEGLSERFYRVVRQAAKETGKPVRLDIVGGSIEIDRGVLDRMTPAFEHLLRNSVVHGIEPADQRAAAGKDPTGTITITVNQIGNEVVVEVRDDGAGLNLPLIRERAQQLGLIDAAADPSPADLANLVFQPGFTTASGVTDLAGRGVGMDVVRTEVNAMGGRIETASTPGQGASFSLLLPLTTAVTQVVMLRCGERSVAVPATLVELVRRVPADELAQAYLDGQVQMEGQTLPFLWLDGLLQGSARGLPTGRTANVLVIRSAAQRVVLHVDEVTSNQEVVIKNLGPQLARLPGLVGMTLLPSGVPALIYNPVALATLYGDAARERTRASLLAEGGDALRAVASPLVPAAPLVLVVDDSLTVRRVTQRLLQREGYRVLLAKDGMEGLDKLAGELPAVVLTDIEMPRMDGFDMVRHMKADPRLARLPLIMITSRIAQKHRDFADELGVNHYLGKPYAEDELLGLVAGYVRAAVPA